MKHWFAVVAVIGLTLTGCASYEQYGAERTAKLREIYPSGMAKAEVQARWGQTQPDSSASRPGSGWDAHPNSYLARKLGDMEAKTGKRIESVDRYWGPDGLMSLCYCWYFYDSGGKLVDVEWQYKSD
jgi:hypothetical protein